jgi:NAD(P)-dependent dehydrogenase (short-subunit alcohol dehydrogenase family)
MIDVNLLGAMAWLNPAAAYMEAKQSGVLLGISSIAGERGRRQNPAYCTSKAALTTYLESLRNRLHRYGVDVVTIKPGFVDTRMTAGKEDLLWQIPPEKAASMALAKAQKGPKTAFVPGRWSLPLFIIRNIPSFVFRKMNI